ncbi:MAG TPA: hypothetical protein VHN99_02535, partial [Deinococcales bacterium]|nr:hypothetical protein [Deinococcales bacterium]
MRTRWWTLAASALALTFAACASTPPAVPTVAVTPVGPLQVTVGQAQVFTAQADGSTGVEWSSTGGQVQAEGNQATFSSLEPGQFTVTATSLADPTVSDSVQVSVPVPVLKVSVPPVLGVGQAAALGLEISALADRS